MSNIKFKVIRDADYGYIVADQSVGAFSFAMVPDDRKFSYVNKSAAIAAAKEYSGQNIPLRMIETPERFESVADTYYGVAW